MPVRDSLRAGAFSKKQQRLALFGILLIGAIVRWWILAVTENGIDFHFNAYDRAIFTWHDWMKSDRWVPMFAYGPLHFYLLRGVFSLTGYDPYYIPRILSLLFGVATLWPLMSIAKKTYGDRAAVWAGVAGAFYPLGVRLSVVSLEVTLFHFLALMAIDSLFQTIEMRRGGKRRAVAAAVWLNLACATRFEGWLLIPLMFLLLVRIHFWRAVLFGAVSSFFPLFWMGVNKIVTGNPIAFATISATVQKIQLGELPLSERIFGWPVILIQTSTWLVVALVIIGAALAVQKRKGGNLAFICFGLFALFIVFAIRGTMALNETKYLATIGFLLLPLAGLAVEWLSQRATGKLRQGIAWGLVAFVVVFSLATIKKDNARFSPPIAVKSLTSFLSKTDAEMGNVLLGVRFQGYILVRSNLPYKRFVLVPGDDTTGKRSERDFWAAVKKEAPCLLVHNVLADRLDFQDLVPIDGQTRKNATINDYDFRTIFKSGLWMVLSVEKAGKTISDSEKIENKPISPNKN